LLVHRPDLPLYDDTQKVGFGLWNYPALAFALEIALLFGGIALYLRATKPKDNVGHYGMMIFGLIIVAVQAYIFFGPPPVSDKAVAATALASYSPLRRLRIGWNEGAASPAQPVQLGYGYPDRGDHGIRRHRSDNRRAAYLWRERGMTTEADPRASPPGLSGVKILFGFPSVLPSR